MQTDFYISIDEPNRFVQSPQNTKILQPVELVFMAEQPMRLRFYRNYGIVNLAGNTTITLTLKEFDEWATLDSLATEATWTKTVSGDDVYYDGVLDLSGSDMQEYFGRSRKSYRLAYGSLALESGYMGYGFVVVPFLAKIIRSPAVV